MDSYSNINYFQYLLSNTYFHIQGDTNNIVT